MKKGICFMAMALLLTVFQAEIFNNNEAYAGVQTNFVKSSDNLTVKGPSVLTGTVTIVSEKMKISNTTMVSTASYSQNITLPNKTGVMVVSDDGEVEIADGSITSAKLDDGAITTSKIAADAIAYTQLVGGITPDKLAGSGSAALTSGTQGQGLISNGNGTFFWGAVESGDTSVTSTSSNIMLTAGNQGVLLVSGNSTVTLPDVSSAQGKKFTMKKVDAENTVTINGTVDGTTNPQLQNIYNYMTVISDGVTWYKICENLQPIMSDTTVVPADVLSGKTFYGLASGQWGQQTGTMSTQTLSSESNSVTAGYYEAATLSTVDTDLQAENIKKDTVIFGVTGTLEGGGSFSAAVAATGITTSYETGDDGDLQAGVEWPDPRFVDNSDGTVTDNLTGLIWLQNANCPNARRTWQTALDDVVQLNTNGTMNGNNCGDTSNSGSHQTDWHLPNINELLSLVDYSKYNPSLPDNHHFTNMQSEFYWSSSSNAYGNDGAWGVNFHYGYDGYSNKSSSCYVRAVRARQ
ncbi:exported hypothetical protein [Candidatus Magnetomoraceae bacterium gMMP-13]